MGGPPGQVDFFISYTSADRAWAEWIAWQLKEAGSSVVLQAWDMVPGLDFVHEMQKATTTAGRTLAVLSPAYFTSQFSEAEWRVAFANDPSGEQRRLIPVRVVDFTPKGLLSARIYIDLVGKDRQAARTALLEGIREQETVVPTEEPTFPGEEPTAVEPFAPGQHEPRFPGALPPIWNVPHLRNPSFTGREDLLEELAASLGGGTATAITQAIAGLGGVGKTSLAVEYAYRQQAAFDVVWWLRAEKPATLVGDFTALAGALNLPEQTQTDPALVVKAVHRWLANHGRWLLVFDNVTQPEDVTSRLPPGGGGQVLVTSRWAAWREVAKPLRLEVLSRPEAIALLRKRTDASDEQAAAALAEALGDLPLALEDAAAYVEATGIGLDDYLRLLGERMVELFGLDAPADDAHADERRVASIWSASLDRVRVEAPGAEALLDLCAFLAPDGIPRALPAEHPEALPIELANVTQDPLRYNEVIRVLGRYSLLTTTPDALGLHRLVQAVIRARLGRLGDEAERQWAKASVGLLRNSFPNDSWEVAAWPACQQLLPHVLMAVDHAQRLGVAGQEVGWLLDRTSQYLREQGHYEQAKPIAERALAVTEQAVGPDSPEVGDRYDCLGRVLYALGDDHGAWKQYQQALAIAEATEGQDFAVGARRGLLGTVFLKRGDLEGARAEFEQALQIGRATLGPDDPLMAGRHSDLGNVLADLGDLEGARAQHERALRITEANLDPDHSTMAIWHSNLGQVLRDLGDLEGARAQHERALEIGKATIGSDHAEMAIRHSHLGQVLRDLGDLPGARAQFERALEIGQATVGPDHPNMATFRRNLDQVLQQLGGE
jgi:tetratricopeptide (TPR) repeat protein